MDRVRDMVYRVVCDLLWIELCCMEELKWTSLLGVVTILYVVVVVVVRFFTVGRPRGARSRSQRFDGLKCKGSANSCDGIINRVPVPLFLQSSAMRHLLP